MIKIVNVSESLWCSLDGSKANAATACVDELGRAFVLKKNEDGTEFWRQLPEVPAPTPEQPAKKKK